MCDRTSNDNKNMNLIDEQVKKIKSEARVGLMTHVVVGYPSLDATISLVKLMAKSGVDFVELQIPFSDPLADGPTIMKACEVSLKDGTRVKDAFEIVKKLSKEVKIPLLFMAYYNTIFKYGAKKFCKDAKKVGISGLIVPDMPLEEESEEHLNKYCKDNNLCNIRVLSPASTKPRIQKNAKAARGFIYCTARQGTTGVSQGLDPKVINYLEQVRKESKVPIAVGFGISTPEHIKMIKPLADIAVVGSKVIDIINQGKKYQSKVKYFLEGLIREC